MSNESIRDTETPELLLARHPGGGFKCNSCINCVYLARPFLSKLRWCRKHFVFFGKSKKGNKVHSRLHIEEPEKFICNQHPIFNVNPVDLSAWNRERTIYSVP